MNQREALLRKESVRLLKRPSALLPPHSVLEHVLGSLRTPDFPTDAAGMQQVSFRYSITRSVDPSELTSVSGAGLIPRVCGERLYLKM